MPGDLLPGHLPFTGVQSIRKVKYGGTLLDNHADIGPEQH